MGNEILRFPGKAVFIIIFFQKWIFTHFLTENNLKQRYKRVNNRLSTVVNKLIRKIIMRHEWFDPDKQAPFYIFDIFK